MPLLSRSKVFSILIFILALLIFSSQVIRFNFVVDDAFISMRYAKNWIFGQGITFNPQDPVRVEGYTNFLFVFLLAAVGRFGAGLLQAAKTIGLISGLCCFGAMALVAKRTLRGDFSMGFGLACFFLACVGPFPLWSGAGLETTLFTLLLVVSVWNLLGTRRREGWKPWGISGALFALLTLCRPEGLGIFALTFLYVLVDRIIRARKGKGKDFSILVPLLWGFLILIGPYFLWRFIYYGHWLPNTYYAKVSWSGPQRLRGLVYVYEFIAAFPSLALLALIGLGAKNDFVKRSTYVLVLMFGYIGYVIAVGGDSLPMYRFIVPILPFAALFAAGGVLRILRLFEREDSPRVRSSMAQIVVLTLVGWQLLMPSFVGKQALYVDNDREQVADRIAIGKWLAENKPDAVIAVNAAGAIPYYSGLKSIDMLGLNEPVIARSESTIPKSGVTGHEKADPEYVLSLAPDIIIPGRNELLKKPGQLFIWLPGDQALLSSRAFQDNYQKVSEPLPGGYFTYFEKKTRKVSSLLTPLNRRLGKKSSPNSPPLEGGVRGGGHNKRLTISYIERCAPISPPPNLPRQGGGTGKGTWFGGRS